MFYRKYRGQKPLPDPKHHYHLLKQNCSSYERDSDIHPEARHLTSTITGLPSVVEVNSSMHIGPKMTMHEL